MRFRYSSLLSVIMFTGTFCLAQTTQTISVEDFKPASSNQPGRQFPQVNSEGRVRTSILAPQAQKVQLDIGGAKYDLLRMRREYGPAIHGLRMRVFTTTSSISMVHRSLIREVCSFMERAAGAAE